MSRGTDRVNRRSRALRRPRASADHHEFMSRSLTKARSTLYRLLVQGRVAALCVALCCEGCGGIRAASPAGAPASPPATSAPSAAVGAPTRPATSATSEAAAAPSLPAASAPSATPGVPRKCSWRVVSVPAFCGPIVRWQMAQVGVTPHSPAATALRKVRTCDRCEANADCTDAPRGRCVDLSANRDCRPPQRRCVYPGGPCDRCPSRCLYVPGGGLTCQHMRPPP